MPEKPGKSSARLRATAVVVGFAVLTALSGCGGSDEKFTTSEADRAISTLNSIQRLVSNGRCEAAAKAANRLAVQSTHVNEDRPELGEAWAGSVAQLQRLLTRECVEIEPMSPTPSVTEPTGATETPAQPEPTAPTDNGDNTDNTDNGDGGAGQDNGGGNEPDTPADNSGGAGPGT